MRRKVAKKKRCHVCNKVTYRDQVSARRAIRNVNRRYEDKVTRVYFCEAAGGFHLTSTDEISGLYAEREEAKNER